MQVSAAVVDRLAANDVTTVFGIPGKQSLPLNDEIDRTDSVRFVLARHETAVSHQAWGFAESSGRMAATVVIPGPGDMNAMNGLKNALNDGTPLLHLAIETEPELRGGDAIHETPPDTYDNVVKENVVVATPESTAATVERAIAVARTPPTGPVRVGIPRNFLQMDIPQAAFEHAPEPRDSDPSTATVTAAAELLTEADTPLVVAGGGVRQSGAAAELAAVARALGAPVVTTYKGKGVLPGDDDYHAGVLSGSASPELHDLIGESDAALVVGSDLDVVTTRRWTARLPERFVHVTLDADDIGVGYHPTVSAVSDAGTFLRALQTQLPDPATATGSEAVNERVGTVRRRYEERIAPLLDDERQPMTSVRALRAVREAVPREAVVTADAGGFRVWGLNVFDAYGPRRYVNPGSWATMGTGVPSAIGAQVANPDRPVVALTGDGGLLMCVHELHTAVLEELPVTVVVFNNDDYAIISDEARRTYDFEPGVYGWSSASVDFVSVAAGMGMHGVRTTTAAETEAAVREAVDADEPRLVEVRTDPNEPQASDFMGA